MAISPDHQRLAKQGAAWLRKNGFGVVTTELSSQNSRERPDVVGFRSSCSAVIEVKVSRADFRADMKKPERSQGGIGVYRFYLCPEGLIVPGELPTGWGLLYARGRALEAIVKPSGNLWPAPGPHHPDMEPLTTEWQAFQHTPDAMAERSALYSIARRLAAGARR